MLSTTDFDKLLLLYKTEVMKMIFHQLIHEEIFDFSSFKILGMNKCPKSYFKLKMSNMRFL